MQMAIVRSSYLPIFADGISSLHGKAWRMTSDAIFTWYPPPVTDASVVMTICGSVDLRRGTFTCRGMLFSHDRRFARAPRCIAKVSTLLAALRAIALQSCITANRGAMLPLVNRDPICIARDQNVPVLMIFNKGATPSSIRM